jgi:glycosyltransferase involved in cell wall biosynthesis
VKKALICTTFNCKNEIETSLTNLISEHNSNLIDEITIVDGGSTDGTWEILKGWANKIDKLSVYQIKGANISKGRNEAIKRTTSDIIVTFDSGTKYNDEWLENILKVFEEESIQVAGASTLVYGNTLFEKCLTSFYDRKTSDSKSFEPSHRGFAMLKEVWEKVGGYPEYVAAGEDTWFNSQWKKLGYKYRYVQDAKSYWKVRSNWKSVFRMQFRNTSGHIALGEKASILPILIKTMINVFFIICLVIGYFFQVFWLAGAIVYVPYLIIRLFGKERWKTFINPIKFCIGLYILSAWELGTALGAIKGITQLYKFRLRQRN